MNVPGKIIREPLLHFLLIGGGLFLLFNLMIDRVFEIPNQIVITPGR